MGIMFLVQRPMLWKLEKKKAGGLHHFHGFPLIDVENQPCKGLLVTMTVGYFSDNDVSTFVHSNHQFIFEVSSYDRWDNRKIMSRFKWLETTSSKHCVQLLCPYCVANCPVLAKAKKQNTKVVQRELKEKRDILNGHANFSMTFLSFYSSLKVDE